jgi:hypothetical protein
MKKTVAKKKQKITKIKKKTQLKRRKHNARSQIWGKVAGVITGAARDAGRKIGTAIEKSEAARDEKNRLEKLRLNFARKYGLKFDRNVPGKFWLDPYHWIYIDFRDPDSVADAERQIRGFVRTSSRVSSRITRYDDSYRGFRNSETSLWDW